MGLDWKVLRSEHVLRACSLVEAGEHSPRTSAKGIFIKHGDRLLPAKHVLRMAYLLAHGLPLDSKIEFSSGDTVINRLHALGFRAERIKSDRGGTH